MSNLLEVSSLTISFGGIKAVEDLSFSVLPNTFVGLMGPNGAGKTTVLNCLSRVYKPKTGRITIEGQDLLAMKGNQLVGLGITRTFQDLNFFNLIPDMMVIDYVRLGQFSTGNNSILAGGMQLKKLREREWELKKAARRILEFFREVREDTEPPQSERDYPVLYGKEGFADLIEVEHQPIGNLSFAWRRRLDLARALVSRPKLILLDEPSQGLSPSEIEKLGDTLTKIRTEFGVSALIVEHNMPLLTAISDKIIVMNSGKKLTEGSPEDVRRNPQVHEEYFGKLNGRTSNVPSTKTASPKGDPILTVKDLDVYYGQAQALFSISLDLYPNQIATVLGTNGSGKSTLLKAISGIEKPTFGEIAIEGEFLPLGWPEFTATRKVQYVPQGHIIFPELSVYDNLKVGGHLSWKSKNYNIKNEIDRVLHFFPQLGDFLQLEGTKLSGGQQQMLAIAQALMARPKVLLLDEPSLGLAPIYMESIFSIIKQISVEEGCSILLVEQNVSKALEVSDYIYMLNAGIMVGKGSSSHFKSDPSIISKNLGFY